MSVAEPLTFAQAVHAIRDQLVALQNAPHEEFEGHGGFCPICGLTTHLLRKLGDYRDD